MVQRVVIHVGCPKTGTSAIQHLLATNPEALARQRFLYPVSPDGFEQHFAATKDLYDQPIDAAGPLGPGAWDRLAAEVTAWPGTAIVSHELLASASPAQTKRAAASFGDAQVQVIITVRDLARQVPSAWQEHVKHGYAGTLDDFIEGIRRPVAERELFARRFWALQDLPHVAMRWATGVGAADVTIVTVPALRGGDATLESRFGEALGLDMSGLVHDQDRRNNSMGIAETEFLRRFNEGFAADISEEVYHELIRERVVRLELGPHRQSSPLRLPPEQFGWVRDRASSWVDVIGEAGYRVIGDLHDLIPSEDSDAPVETIDEADVLNAAIRALAGSASAYAAIREELDEERLKSSRLGELKRRLLRR